MKIKMKPRLWLVVACLLVHFLTCALANEVGNFTVEGDILLPSTGDYSNIPDKSCVRITVQDAIQCLRIGCTVPVRGRIVLQALQGRVVNDRIPYKVESSGGGGHYSISFTFNVGWCGDGTKKGDYHNDYAVDIQLNVNNNSSSSSTVYRDVFLTFYSYESLASTSIPPTQKPISPNTPTTRPEKTSMKTTIKTTTRAKNESHVVVVGSVVLPEKGIYTDIPTGSCLRVDINEDIQCEHCDIPKVATVKLDVSQVTGNRIKFAINAGELEKGRYYRIAALLNVGWCMVDGSSEWLRPGDYFNDVAHSFIAPRIDGEVVNVDISVREHQKYLCGEHQCYKRENCTRNYKGEPVCKCPPYACADFAQPEWVCGSDGQNHASECWMKATDCFSGTIRVVNKGKCGSPTVGEFFSEKKNVVCASVGLIILIILTILLVIFFVKKNRHRNMRRGTTSKNPIMFSNDSIYGRERPPRYHDGEPIYESVKDDAAVKLPAKQDDRKPKMRAENIYVITSHRPPHHAPPYSELASPPPPYDENGRVKHMYGMYDASQT